MTKIKIKNEYLLVKPIKTNVFLQGENKEKDCSCEIINAGNSKLYKVKEKVVIAQYDGILIWIEKEKHFLIRECGILFSIL